MGPLSHILQDLVITILFSISTGAILTYIVQKRARETNAWKTEAALRKIDDIYGPIHSELNNILGFSGKELTYLRSSFYGDPNKSWESIARVAFGKEHLKLARAVDILKKVGI